MKMWMQFNVMPRMEIVKGWEPIQSLTEHQKDEGKMEEEVE